MKTLRILLMLGFAVICSSAKGHGHDQSAHVALGQNSEYSCSSNTLERIYINPQSLHFSDEGIFLETPAHGWKQIRHLHHDAKGYYLRADSKSADSSSRSSKPKVWICPKCNEENTSTSGVCEFCLWPLYEWDW